MTNRRRAQFQLHVSVFLFGFTAILGALVSLGSVVLVWWRLALTVAAYVLLLRLRGPLPRLPRVELLRLTGIGVILGLHWVTFYGSIKLAGASVALVCLSSATFFAAVIEPLLGRRRHSWRELALGLVVIAGIGLIFAFEQRYLGIAIGVVSAVLSALVGILNKPVAARLEGSVINFHELAGCLLVFTLAAPAYYWLVPGDAYLPRGMDWLWLLLLALVCTNFAYDLSLRALRHLSAFEFILAINLEPIYGVVLAFLILGEGREFDWGFFVGAGLVFGAVFFQAALAVGRQVRRLAVRR